MSGFVVEQQRDDASCRVVPSYSSREDTLASSPGRRSIGAYGKDMIRTFQTTIQSNSRSHQMMPENGPASPYLQPRLQKMASEGSRIAESMRHSAIVDGVNDKLSNVNDKLSSVNGKIGSMLRRSHSDSAGALYNDTGSSSDRGIYSSQPAVGASWGRPVLAEISSFTTQKMAPLFRRQNSYPFVGNGNHSSHGNTKGTKEVSFDYQLMKDSE